MTRFRLLPLLILVLAAPALVARGLDKYRNWPSSPQGYFMTSAERAEWKANVKTDDDAEQFINKFVASRGAGFAEEVAKRASIADQRLSVAGRAGSLTTRGKIIILLGPPTTFTMAQRDVKGARTGSLGGINSSGSTSGGGKIGEGQGQGVSDMADAATRSSMTNSTVTDYTFTYAAASLPGKPAKDLVIAVEVNQSDGSDKINDRRIAAQLDDLFEQAAAARLATASAPKP